MWKAKRGRLSLLSLFFSSLFPHHICDVHVHVCDVHVHVCEPLIIVIIIPKVFLTGENLASVPGLIGSNFSEKDVYALKIIEHCSLNKPRTHHNKPIKQQNTEIPSEEEIFNPFLKIIVSEWVWMIQNSDGIRDITMATVELTNSTITIGSLVKFSKDTTNDGVAVKLCVNNVSGVEGEEKDNRQK